MTKEWVRPLTPAEETLQRFEEMMETIRRIEKMFPKKITPPPPKRGEWQEG